MEAGKRRVRGRSGMDTMPLDQGNRDGWRSMYTTLLRNESIRANAVMLVRPDQDMCFFTLQPATFENLDFNHVIDSQTSGFAIVSCSAAHAFFAKRMREVDTSLPGFVQRSVLQPFFQVHNADLNLRYVSHASNMKKKSAVELALKAVGRGHELERGLHGVLARQFSTGMAAVDADEADACASRVVAALREVLPAYTAQLGGVTEADPAFATLEPANRANAVRAYTDVAEYIERVFDEDLRLGR